MHFSAQFKLEKETKGTFRYAEETAGQPPKIGTLYVQKWALPKPHPGAASSLSKHWTDPRCPEFCSNPDFQIQYHDIAR